LSDPKAIGVGPFPGQDGIGVIQLRFFSPCFSLPAFSIIMI